MKLPVFVKLFYVYQFFFDFIFLYAVEKLFLLDRGLNLSQIGILLFLWSVMSLMLEMPTGILADHWSRRKMLILSGVFFSVCYILFLFSHSFYVFLLGFFFRTLGSTFASGTLPAYVYDFLKIHQQERNFEKIWGRGNALRTIGIGSAVAFGGFLSEISYTVPVIMSAVSILSLSVLAYLWPEIKPITITGEENYWQLLREAVSTVKRNPSLLQIVLYSTIVLSVFANLEEYNDIYLQFLGFSNRYIGLIFMVATIGQSVASLYAHKFKKYSWATLNTIAAIGVMVLLLAWVVKTPLMAAGILLLGILLELSNVLNQGIIQQEVPEDKRATISSLNSFVSNLLPFQLIFGLIAGHYHLQLSYLVFAITVSLYFLMGNSFGNRAVGIVKKH